MTQRTDLPLSDDSTTRLVPWIVGVMAYLAALALTAALTLSNVAREWSEGLEGSLTVQVPAAEADASQTTDAKIVAAVRVLLKTDGVDSARPITMAEIGKMLEPWLGSAPATADLPLPRVIDVQLKPGAEIDFIALAERLENAVPGASLETHEKWRNTMLLLFRSIEAVAIVVILLIFAVALAAIILTTRSVLAVHHEIVELLHLIGAQDTYIAEQFQKHAFHLALKGSVGGTACALTTLIGIVQLTGDLDASLLPPAALAYWHWPVLALLPAAEAYGAMFTARLTILHALRRMG